MKKTVENFFDKALEWAGITLAIMGALVVITIIAIVIIVQVLKALAIVAIGLCVAMALGMMVWACVSQVMEGHKKDNKKN